MKTVLKDLSTGLLFRNMDQWTPSIDEAAGFKDSLAALKFCQRNSLTRVAVVQIFKQGAAQRVAGFHQPRTAPKALA